MSQDNPDRDHTNEAPTRFTSGAIPEPQCPYCSHVRSVRPLAEVAAPPRRDPYGWIANLFPPGRGPDPKLRRLALVPPGRRQLPRTLRPPRPPWSMGQVVDRRLTAIIDVAFLGLALFLAGRFIRAMEFVGLAALLAVLALVLTLWLAVALATGQFRRVNGQAQDRYDRALRRWQALRYCEDCGHLFRADGRGSLPPQAVPRYLEHEGPDTIPTSGAGA